MATLNWDQLLADLRADDVERALTAGEEIAAHVTVADLPRIYALTQDDDYFVRVMAGEILVQRAGISALPALMSLMARNEDEGLGNDGLENAVKRLIDTNPIMARATLEPLGHDGTERFRALARWGLAGVPEESTVVTPLVAAPPGAGVPWYRGCLPPLGVLLLVLTLASAELLTRVVCLR